MDAVLTGDTSVVGSLPLCAILGAAGLTISVLFSHNRSDFAAMGFVTSVPQFCALMPSVVSSAAAAMWFAVANSVGIIAEFISPFPIEWVKDSTGSTTIGVLIVAGGPP